jgi:hypothetical protein
MPIGAPTTPEQIASAEAEAHAMIARLNPAPATPATPSPGQASDSPPAINVRTINATDPSGVGEWSQAETGSAMNTLREFGLAPDDAAFLESGKELWVSPRVREIAKTELARVKRDPEWVARYLKGGIEEARLMSAISLRLAAPVREP